MMNKLLIKRKINFLIIFIIIFLFFKFILLNGSCKYILNIVILFFDVEYYLIKLI